MQTTMLDRQALDAAITASAEYYEKSAPTVEGWLDDLYIRLNEWPDDVRVTEILMVERLKENGQWMQPNMAANQVYRMLHRLGRCVTGQAGF